MPCSDHTPASRWSTAGAACGGVVALLLLAGCGDSRSSLPPELVSVLAMSGGGGADYPDGPYGSLEGDTAQNLCFTGWADPEAADYDFGASAEVCFADFYVPAEADVKLLYVATAAGWCIACRNEYRGSASAPSLGQQLAMRGEGITALGALFQNDQRQPASEQDAELWARTFEVDFPFVRDDAFRMGAFANANSQPFGMLIDTRTMTILQQFEGDVPAVLWPAVDDLLEDGD